MYCKKCGVKAGNDARFCVNCGEAISITEIQAGKTPTPSPVDVKTTEVGVNERKTQNTIRLAVRSFIVGAISSPITEGEYWVGFFKQAVEGVIVALILYGAEKVIRRGREPKMGQYSVAAYRASLMVFVLSLIKFGDPYRAMGSMITGAIFAALLCLIEVGFLKPFQRNSKTAQ